MAIEVCDDRPVSGQRLSCWYLLQSFFYYRYVATIVTHIELSQLGGRRFLHFSQGGPALQKIAGLERVQLASPLQAWGK